MLKICFLLKNKFSEKCLSAAVMLFAVACCISGLCSCHESLEQRAEREAQEYTKKYCPTPVSGYTRTDSVAFDKSTRTFIYYCTLTGKMDDKEIIDAHKEELQRLLKQAISNSTTIKAYKEAGFNFAYVCHSDSKPQLILYQSTFTPKDYQ